MRGPLGEMGGAGAGETGKAADCCDCEASEVERRWGERGGRREGAGVMEEGGEGGAREVSVGTGKLTAYVFLNVEI